MRQTTPLAIGAAALAAADTVIVKLLAPHIHAFEIAFFRSWFGLLIALPFLIRGQSIFRSSMLPKHVLRAVLKYCAMVAFFLAVTHAPVADVTAISLLAPPFTLLGAWLFLRQKQQAIHFAAMILGLVGAAIIVQPGTSAFNPYLLLAVAGAAGLSSVLLLLKQLTDTDTPATILFWNLLLTAGISILPAVMVWSTPGLEQVILLGLQGGLSAAGILMMAHAAKQGVVGAIAALDFISLPIAAVLAFVLLREPIHTPVFVGGIIILLSVIILWFEKSYRGK
jgi:drug/metabolite transporter (DMT)-like permease